MTALSLPKPHRMPQLYFIILSAVTVFLYFELMTNVWFLKLTGSYLIKVWVPPLLLFIHLYFRNMLLGKPLSKIGFSNLMLFFYSVFGIISMFNSETPYFAIKYYLIMIAPVWFYFVIVENFRDNRNIELLLKILFVSCAIYSMHTFYLNILYSGDPVAHKTAIVTSAGSIVENTTAAFGVSDQVISRGLLSVEHSKYCGMISPAILFGLLFFIKSTAKSRYVYLGLSLFMLLTSIATLSRAGVISIFVGLFILLWCLFMYEKMKKKIALFSFSFSLILLSYIFVEQKNAFLRMIQLLNIFDIEFINNYLFRYDIYTSPDVAIDPHLESILLSLNSFLDNPLLGLGYSFTEGTLMEHNRYLFILASSGLLTLIPYVLFFIALTLLSWKAMRKFNSLNQNRFNYGYLFYACNIMFLVKLMNEGMETFYYWIIFALASAWVRNTKNEHIIEANYNVKT